MKVLSIEQMTKLKELGVDVTPKEECLMYTSDSSDNYYLKYGESVCEDDIKAFTLQDVIELLPAEIVIDCFHYDLVIHKKTNEILYECYIDEDEEGSYELKMVEGDSLFDAAYNMLIWVIENGHLKTK